ncbi:hypothetical protein J2W94_000054 [Pseudoxanthomonas sacheonensis]|uniref:Peptidase M56 domain-containing protein n=2 Tax=Pseudoxanthomonas sacheonensis TaxID=443615 RepID=A0ABU1RN98_9GAMM|nr:hypothetical protein [Pseudoxanthomonas sacheonensis]
MLAVLLPAPVREAATLARGALVAMDMAPMPSVASDSTAIALPDYRIWLPLLWFCGVVFSALFFHRMQRRYLRALGIISPVGGGIFVSQAADACPAVVGAWKPRIVLPADFEARYPSREGEMVLAHERAHLRRGDTAVNLVVVALRCAYWFNPLLHWAAARFRQDQEMACDAVVLGQFPDRRRTYAEAMLKTQLAVLGLPVGCHWQSSQSLKERIMMLKRPLPGKLRRRIGVTSVLAVLIGSSYMAWASQPANGQAPIYQGHVDERAIAIVNIRIPEDMPVQMEGPSMYTAADKSTNAMLNGYSDLVLKSTVPESAWSLRVKASGSADAPSIEWTLTSNGRETKKTHALESNSPVAIDLASLVDAQGRSPVLTLSRMPADRIIPLEKDRVFGRAPPTLVIDDDGVFRQVEPVRMVGMVKADGDAMLLLHLDEDGRVSKVDIEEVRPAGALTSNDAREIAIRDVYVPKRINGKAVPSRVRVPVKFWRETPPLEEMYPELAKTKSPPQ